MNANELADELENKDRLWNVDEKLMIETCAMLRSQQKYINILHKLLNKNGIGVGRNLLTGEVIPFEVEDEQ